MLTFLHNLDPDLRRALILQLRNLWTHSSTAIEGNTLTLGETAFVLEEGLTVSGKPLKDHEEVVGHARAIDLLYQILQEGREFTENDLFVLHKAVQTEVIFDVHRPVGRWKKEQNSTAGVVDGKQVIFDYARPEDVPELMKQWFALFSKIDQCVKPQDREYALSSYSQLHISFVRIHPFFDGNGRLSRLVSNLPVLKAGLPPIIIPREKRKEYIDLLSAYHSVAGQIHAGCELLPHPYALKPFMEFSRNCWLETMALVDAVNEKQTARKK